MWTGLADWRAFVPSTQRTTPVTTARIRRLAPLALLAGAGLALAGCGSSDDGGNAKSDTSASSSASPSSAVDSSGCVKASSGDTSDGVKVTGDFGKKPTATFDKPLKADGLERTIVTKGTGETTTDGETVNALVTVYLGTGKSLGTQPLSITVGSSSIPDVFEAGAACLPIGSRTVATVPAKDVYGAQGNPQVGISADDSMVVVTDLLSKKQQLVPAAWTKNVPQITVGKNGTPKVTLPKTKPPAQLELKVLKQGSGDTVKSGDTVTLDYQGTSWNTGKIFDQSYGKSPASFPTDQVVEGFGAALVGQKVGTRLVVTIPPKYAYGKKGSGQQLAGQTLLFVIDIKATKSS
jgi:peptidylprolyl isomerase